VIPEAYVTFTTAIFAPMIAHVGLVYGLYFLLLRRRTALVKAGEVEVSAFRDIRDEPTESLRVRNNIANQFELPVLFHIGCLALFIAEADNEVALILAWLFVVSRYVHAYVHVTSNRLRWRMPAFLFGYAMLGLMWLWLLVWITFS